jgi:hypothetical protein
MGQVFNGMIYRDKKLSVSLCAFSCATSVVVVVVVVLFVVGVAKVVVGCVEQG